jgi:hypothetical protein
MAPTDSVERRSALSLRPVERRMLRIVVVSDYI